MHASSRRSTVATARAAAGRSRRSFSASRRVPAPRRDHQEEAKRRVKLRADDELPAESRADKGTPYEASAPRDGATAKGAREFPLAYGHAAVSRDRASPQPLTTTDRDHACGTPAMPTYPFGIAQPAPFRVRRTWPTGSTGLTPGSVEQVPRLCAQVT